MHLFLHFSFYNLLHSAFPTAIIYALLNLLHYYILALWHCAFIALILYALNKITHS